MKRYKAFVSYSHDADSKLAPTIQRGLHRFRRGWYQSRGMHVFRDQTNLSASPGLWSSIEAALEESEFFILLVSPQAAVSKWISREVEYWLSHRSSETMFLILTDGNIIWDAEHGDFDWSASTLPPNLRSVYREEPNWVDMRWVKNGDELLLRDPRFWDKVADIAAVLLGRPKDELVGEDVRQQARARRLTLLAMAALAFLTIVSIATAFWANRERKLAIEQEQIAIARQLAAQSVATRQGSITMGTLLAVESAYLRPLAENNAALQHVVAYLRTRRAQMVQGDAVLSLRFIQNGAYLATVGQDRLARIFGIPRGNLAAQFPAGDDIKAVQISVDGRYLATGANDHSVRLFDFRAKQQVTSWSHGDTVNVIVFSPDGRFVASASADGTVEVIDTTTHKLLAELKHGNTVVALAFSPDSQYLVSGSYDTTAHVTRTSDWKEWRVLKARASITAVTVSSDSNYIGLGSYDNAGHIFEVRTGKELLLLPAEGPVKAIAFSRDERYVAIGGYDKTTRVFETATGKPTARITHENFVESLLFSTDGRVLAARDLTGRVGLFTPEDGTRVAQFEEISVLEFSPDGQFLATAGADGVVRLWDISSYPRDMHLVGSGDVFAVAFSENRQFVAVTADALQVFAVGTAQLVGQAHTKEQPTEVALSPDGRYVVVDLLNNVTGKETLTAYDIETRRIVAQVDHPGSIDAVAFTPDGQALVTANTGIGEPERDGKGRIFNLLGGELLSVIPDLPAIDTIAFSRDKKYIAVHQNKSARVIDFSKGTLLARFDEPLQIVAVTISPDGKYLATGIADRSVHLYAVATRRLLTQINKFGAAFALDFSSDGRYLAVGSTDKSAAVFEVSTGRELSRWDCGGDVKKIAFSLDDKYVYCAAKQSSNDAVVVLNRDLWRTEDLINAACSGVGRNFWHWEWNRYFGDQPYRRTCPQLPDPESNKETTAASPGIR